MPSFIYENPEQEWVNKKAATQSSAISLKGVKFIYGQRNHLKVIILIICYTNIIYRQE